MAATASCVSSTVRLSLHHDTNGGSTISARICTRFAFATFLAFLSTLLSVAHAAVSVQLVEAGPRTTLLRITVGAPKLEDVDTPAGKFQRFSQREGGQGGAGIGPDSLGHPELPVIGFPLALPIDLKTLNVDVKPEGDPRTLQATIFPVQPVEIARKQDRELPKFQFDRDLYLKGSRQPGQALERNSIFKGDANVATFKFSPFGYDPANGILTYYPSYLVTIFHDAGDCFVIDRLVDARTLPSFDGIDQHFERLPLPGLPFALNKAFGGGEVSKAMTLETIVFAWARVSTGNRPMPNGGMSVGPAPNWPYQMSLAFFAESELLFKS